MYRAVSYTHLDVYKRQAYGIDVSAEEIRTTETETLKTTVREKVEVR